MDLDQVVYVVDENLLRLGNGIVAVRRDTARSVGHLFTSFSTLEYSTPTGYPLWATGNGW
jgi:hypothetical protein